MTLTKKNFGSYTGDTQLNVASASKWVTAAVLMSLVESGELDLYAPASTYLPALPPEIAAITLNQMLSHTSGLPGIAANPIDLQLPVEISLYEAALAIAEVGISHQPGSTFDYGGASFQLAGAIAEQVTGTSWEALFQSRVATRLGMANSFYGHPLRRYQGQRGLTNPNLQGGLHTTPDDYWRFLSVIANYGRYSNGSLLKQATVQSMETTRLANTTVVNLPRAAKPGHQYGFGMWCEEVEPAGVCTLVSSSGAWGTYPWIDRRRGISGLIVVKDRLPNVMPWLDEIREVAAAITAQAASD